MQSTRRTFLGTAAASAVAVASRPAHAASLPLGARDAGAPATIDEIPTPALILRLDSFEANVSKMASALRAANRAFRPHGKTHKCPEIARRLVAAGAVGACAAKLSEAEVFADAGIGGILVTTAVIGRPKIARAVRLAQRHPDTTFVVDNEANARDLDAAVAALSRNGPPLKLQVAIDLLFGRTGIEGGAPAVALAQAIDKLPNLTLAGLQAYDGGSAHVIGFDARKTRSTASMQHAAATRTAIERAGIACPLLTGGSTGTYNIDSQVDGVTELQPGSFVFMDLDYNRIGGTDGEVYQDFESALTVLTTVVSQRPGTAIVDGGYKAFSTDRTFGPRLVDPALADVPYAWAGDEHGRLDLSRAQREVRVGDRLELLVPHCDPTVNLYDNLYAVRGERVEGVWPIAARGMSQ